MARTRLYCKLKIVNFKLQIESCLLNILGGFEHLDAAAAAVVFYIAIDQGEKRVIVSPANAFAGMKNSA